ncbi:MAG: RNA-binding protein [Proteobacteria bacterium]|nr:RNA-binding protein [Pseudomonadota bacterium]
MPKGPRGEKRPADVIGAAIMVAKLATGEITEEAKVKSAAAELGSRGGKARAEALSKKRRKEIAQRAATERWKKT